MKNLILQMSHAREHDLGRTGSRINASTFDPPPTAS